MRKLFAWIISILLLSGSLPAYAENDASAAAEDSVIPRLLEKDLNQEEIIQPVILECDSQMLHFTAAESFLDVSRPADGMMLYFVFKIDSRDLNSLPVYLEQEHEDQIEFDGKTVSLDQFRGHRNLISVEIVANHDSWSWYEYNSEGLFVIVCRMNPDLKSLENESVMLFSYECENIQTGKRENGTISVGLPPMIRRSNQE